MYKIMNFIYQSKGVEIYMKRICIIPCGKIWDKHSDYGPMEAKDVYISPFGKACQAYATMFSKTGLYYRRNMDFKTK